jgi:hypothetical protein
MPPEKRRRYDDDFRAGAVGVVRETNRSVTQVAKGPRDQPGDPCQLGDEGQARTR